MDEILRASVAHIHEVAILLSYLFVNANYFNTILCYIKRVTPLLENKKHNGGPLDM